GLLTRHKLRNQQIQFVRKLEPGISNVMGDAVQLSQAFLNLTLNAVEAMPSGGTLTISSRATPEPRSSTEPTHVVVEFTDTGHGMSSAQRERAFTSLLSTTKKTGTGLGLAIVARVVETHRGKIKIRSTPGKGTTITLALPIK